MPLLRHDVGVASSKKPKSTENKLKIAAKEKIR